MHVITMLKWSSQHYQIYVISASSQQRCVCVCVCVEILSALYLWRWVMNDRSLSTKPISVVWSNGNDYIQLGIEVLRSRTIWWRQQPGRVLRLGLETRVGETGSVDRISHASRRVHLTFVTVILAVLHRKCSAMVKYCLWHPTAPHTMNAIRCPVVTWTEYQVIHMF